MKTPVLILALCVSLSLPAAAGISVVGSLTRTLKAKPGDKFEGVILVRNGGTEDCDVRVSQVDYQFYADGRNVYGDPGKAPRSNGGWFTLNPSRLSIPKGQTLPVHYRGVVPAQTNLNGSYWSLVIVEPFTPPAPAVKGANDKPKLGLQTLVRFGVQMVTEIGTGGDTTLKILDKRIARQDGRRLFQLDVENQGNRFVNPAAWVELYDPQGKSIGKFEARPMRIYPTCSVRYNLDLSDVPPGKYSALAVVEQGGNDAVGGQYELQIEN